MSGIAQTTNAATLPHYNSQNIPLLAPAINLDPNPAKGGGDITVVGGSALVAEAGPSGTLADITEHPSSSQISVYTVHKGDTLAGIASMFDVTVNTIVWANDIKGGIIREGDQLIILPITGLRHTVQKGETLATLAKKYKADAAEIAQFNDVGPGASLAVGTNIIIPDGEAQSASASKPKSSAAKATSSLRGANGPQLPGYYSWPVAGGTLTQSLHGYNGIDIGASVGTPILAAADGIVIVAREGGWNGGYGSYVVVQHSNGTQTLYSHASRVLVSVGDEVSQGQTIAKVGATGKATGAHLHFEVRGAANPFSKLSVGLHY